MSLVIQNLGYKKSSTWIVENINFKLEPGQVTALLGLNGSGKTTLIKLLAGEIQPAKGQILLNNRPLAQWPSREQAKIRAVLPQHSNLTFPFRVWDVVLMGRLPHATTAKENARLATQVLEAMQITSLKDRLYSRLSGGEKQLVQLARVLVQIWEPQNLIPHWLLLDEPTLSLDFNYQRRIWQILQRIAARNIGVLVSTHDIEVISQHEFPVLILQQTQLYQGYYPLPQIEEILLNGVLHDL